MLVWKPRQGKPVSYKDIFHEFVPLLAVLALVGFIIQFDHCDRTNGLGVALQEIDMFAVELVGGDAEFAWVVRFGVEQILERNLGDDCPVGNRSLEHQEKDQFLRG